VLGGTNSIFGALSQNSAADRAMAAQRDAARSSMGQAANAAGLEAAKNARRRAQILGEVRAMDNPGTAAGLLLRQADVDASINDQIIKANYSAQARAIRAGYTASAEQIASNTINPLLAGLTGIIGGVSTGLSLGGSIDRAGYASDQADLSQMRLDAMRYGGMPR